VNLRVTTTVSMRSDSIRVLYVTTPRLAWSNNLKMLANKMKRARRKKQLRDIMDKATHEDDGMMEENDLSGGIWTAKSTCGNR